MNSKIKGFAVLLIYILFQFKIDKFDDLYFKREKKPAKKGNEEEFFGEKEVIIT